MHTHSGIPHIAFNFRTGNERSDGVDHYHIYSTRADEGLSDLKSLFAAGFDLGFDEINITLPQGAVRSTARFSFAERDPATFEWPALLLSTEASADLSVPAGLLESEAQGNAQVGMLVGGGFLQKRGEDYVMEAELKKGLLTINGAPMPIPLGGM